MSDNQPDASPEATPQGALSGTGSPFDNVTSITPHINGNVTQLPITPVIQYNHMMFDIESLSLDRFDAMLLECAWQMFNLDGEEEKKQEEGQEEPRGGYIYAMDDPANGEKFSVETIGWWLAPERTGRFRELLQFTPYSLAESIENMRDMAKQHRVRYIWARGPGFDLSNLASRETTSARRFLMEIMGAKPLFSNAYAWRDSRPITMLMGPLYKHMADAFFEKRLQHVAANDVELEVLAVQRAFEMWNKVFRQADIFVKDPSIVDG